MFLEHGENRSKQKKRPPSCQDDPRGCPIMESAESDNPVMRISALIRGQAKKAALGTSYRRRVGCLPSGQSQAHPHRLTSGFCGSSSLYLGGYTRPSKSLAGWQFGYTHFNATAQFFLGHQFGDHAHTQRSKTVGARSDPPSQMRLMLNLVHGCAVNKIERASGLIRLHTAVTLLCGPNGWGSFA